MLSYQELQIRAALFQSIRTFFLKRQFLEVDTPVRLPHIIPELHIQPIQAEGHYLQTSPELCMKRLLARGCTRIFQICHCFRKEEKGRRHLEEFTMLEWYRVDADYFDLMDDCESLIRNIIRELGAGIDSRRMFSNSLCYEEIANIVNNPWKRMSVSEAFSLWSPIALENVLKEDCFDEVITERIEPHLGIEQPTFLYDYPMRMASLARKKEEDNRIAERFELYLQGVELANGFSELTDPNEQEDRFSLEIDSIRTLYGRETSMPTKFLHDLKSIDNAAGIAFGVDRLFMLLLGKDDIRDATPFAPEDM